MKVLLLSNSLKKGGKEKQLFLLIKGLEIQGIDYRLLLRHNDVEFKINSSKCIALDSINDFRQLLFIRKYIKKYNPDIIHTWEGRMGFFVLISALNINVPIIDGAIRFCTKFHWYAKALIRIRIVNKLSTVTVANSLAGLKTFNFKLGKKNRVITNGVDLNEFKKYLGRTNNNCFTIGMVANFTKPKDYPLLISVIINLLNAGNDIKCVFVGGGSFLNDYKSLIPNKYIDRFLFTGFQNNSLEFIKDFDVGVLLSKPRHSEGMSNAIIEYMALGKPVIATNTGGNPELIINNKIGFLIDHSDEKGLEEAILFFINNPNRVKAMGIHAQKQINENFSFEAYINKWLKLYNELI